MAVRANDIAFGYLRKDRLLGATTGMIETKPLASEHMVEIHTLRGKLPTAINTRDSLQFIK